MCSPEPHQESPNPRSLEELEREICELAAHIAAAMCRWLLMVGEFDARSGWSAWGVRSCAHWLSWRCSIGLQTARQHVRVARRLQELPRVCAAFAAGELSYCKVRAITRVATPQTEEQLLELARYASGAQLERIAASFRGALAANLEMVRQTHDVRHLSWSWEEDGSLTFSGRLPADEGALLVKALQTAGDGLGSREEPETTNEAQPAAARNADALVELCRSEKPCELIVHVDADALAGADGQGRAEIEDGPGLCSETARRLGCDAAVARIIERDGRPLSVGRRTRVVSPALRRALRARDRGCRFPGCTHQKYLHAHHIHHWARGGRTELSNLVQLCSYHHRLVHEGGFTVEPARAAGGLSFRRPDGRVIHPCTARPATGPPIENQNRTRGLLMTDRTCTGKTADAPFDMSMTIDGLIARQLAEPG